MSLSDPLVLTRFLGVILEVILKLSVAWGFSASEIMTGMKVFFIVGGVRNSENRRSGIHLTVQARTRFAPVATEI